MKRLLFLLLLCASLTAGACCNDSLNKPLKKWSFGVIVLNYSYYPKDVSDLHILPGLVVRRDFGAFRLRASAEVSYRALGMSGEPYPDEMYTTEKELESTLRFGIEKGWILRKYVRPYVALDLAGSCFKSDYTSAGGITGLIEERISKRKSAGFLPVAGVEFFLSKHLSLSFEAQAALIYGTKTQHTIYYSGNVDTRPQTEKGFEAYIAAPGNVGLHLCF